MQSIYMLPEIELDTPIRQYMRLDYFLALLKKNKYNVKQKGSFKDRNEQMPPFKSLFAIHAANENLSKDTIDTDEKRRQEILTNFQQSSTIPTSCWTLQNHENNLMWDVYASKIGVCLVSTIERFIKSLKCRNYEVICGKMKYYNANHYSIDEHFWKTLPYISEDELRMYFVETLNGDNTLSSDVQKNNIDLEVDPAEMISEVIISPYVHKSAAALLRDWLRTSFNLNCKISDLNISD